MDGLRLVALRMRFTMPKAAENFVRGDDVDLHWSKGILCWLILLVGSLLLDPFGANVDVIIVVEL
jgi:hypothetical protein